MNSPGSQILTEKFKIGQNRASAGGMGAMYLKIFKLYLEMTARDKALIYGEKALEHYRKTGDNKTCVFILEQLAELYDFFDRYDNALICYSQCEQLENSGHNSADET